MTPKELSRYEYETTILFNELETHAVLWTASRRMRNQWRDAGYPVQITLGGWRAEVPQDRIVFKVLKRASNP